MMFQTRCAGCDSPGSPLCTTCRFALLGPAPAPLAAADGGSVPVLAAVAFSGRARDVLLGLKYRNRRAVARHVAGVLVNRLLAAGVPADVDVVTWAPTGGARRRRRGYDQGEVIARTVARQLGLPCRALLRRTRSSGTQTGRTRSERLAGPEFLARPGLHGLRVLVVDDVVTTGSTLRAAERALVDAGAAHAVLAAVAATPARRAARVVPIGAHRAGPVGAPRGRQLVGSPSGPRSSAGTSRRGAPAAA